MTTDVVGNEHQRNMGRELFQQIWDWRGVNECVIRWPAAITTLAHEIGLSRSGNTGTSSTSARAGYTAMQRHNSNRKFPPRNRDYPGLSLHKEKTSRSAVQVLNGPFAVSRQLAQVASDPI